MTLSRLIAYGVAGIFAGLLIENQALVARQRLLKKAVQKKKQMLKASEKFSEA